ncbi:flagellar basal body L-ring protein FlgH [Roseitranquillus sediminis]|uniref:flagellar basal body L-ring protein FlgH n=1 Tax=Roseitranquillus sediminis TaxID=2809051 RepID=UPI001D0C52D5|nr:flagellar basal body L-ring protein FlgH [Roseitranquillus sediminis]MBM9596125.1 flagellar basal body L-ring protein FlgH [Roseitranquillus sediminis]
MRYAAFALAATLALSACSTTPVGRAPAFTPVDDTLEHRAMATPTFPEDLAPRGGTTEASLWSGGRSSLLGDRRAGQRGDILTVVIEIDEKAEMRNTSARSRSGSENMGINSLFGLPGQLPAGVELDPGVGFDSSSESEGTGSVRRNEKLELRVAATVVDVLNNGVLKIQGSQEVRVNFEIRELLVTGYVRPADITRQNEITYDKIASARISYGGRGQITDMQQPRYGQQIVDKVLPF